MIYKSGDKKVPKNVRELFKSVLQKKQTHYMPIFEVKAYDPAKSMTVSGCANKAIADRGSEIIDPKAWDLENFKKNPVVLWEHDYQKPIGSVTDLQIKEDGLYYQAVIGRPEQAPLTSLQIEVRSLIAQGILKANSVGFLPHVVEYDEENETLRYIKVELLELSFVSVPMQQDSLVTSVKRMGKKMTDPNAQDPNASEDQGQENQEQDALKAMADKVNAIGDTCAKILDMCQKMSEKAAAPAAPAEEPKPEDAKALKAKIEKLEAEKKAIEDESNKLLDSLKKQGLLK